MRLRRRTRRKTRGGRMSSISSRTRSRSRSPSGIRIISARVPVPILEPTQELVIESVNEEIGPIGRELWNFKVKCGNGEEHTSPHLYTRMEARNAAREYCRARGGVNGRIEYTMSSR